MLVVRQCSSGLGGVSNSPLGTVLAEISEHSTSFHLKLVEFGAKCAARARENGGEDAEDEPAVEDEEEDTADAVAAATITQQAEEQAEEETADSTSDAHDDEEKPVGAAATAGETESEEAEPPQAELRDRYALGALKRVRYKLDGKLLHPAQQPALPHVHLECIAGDVPNDSAAGRDACRLGALAHDPSGLAGSHGPTVGASGEAGQPLRPLDHSSRLSVSEHVERVISEATSLENLSLMYEGWTPWIVRLFLFCDL